MPQAERLLHFIHTTEFDRSWAACGLGDNDLRAIQRQLCRDPLSGDVIPGAGGVRKLRFGGRGKGKRGGFRMVYLPVARTSTVYLLLVYSKNEADDLSEAGKRQLRRLALLLEE